MKLKDFNVNDIIKFKGKSINSFTKDKEYIVIKKEKEDRVSHVAYYKADKYFNVVSVLDNNNNIKKIYLTDNRWRKMFIYVSNLRKEKIRKLNESNQ